MMIQKSKNSDTYGDKIFNYVKGTLGPKKRMWPYIQAYRFHLKKVTGIQVYAFT